MNILFLMLAFPKEEEGSNLYNDIVSEVASQGHNVTVVAPHQKETVLSKERGIKVLRVKSGTLLNVGPIQKGINNVLLPFYYKKAIKRFLLDETFDWIVSPTPPITLSSVVCSCKKWFNAKSYLILRDIFPQNAVDLGLIRNRFLHSYFRKKEIDLYQNSDIIGCMSQGNIDYVLQHNIMDSSKLVLLPNWIKYQEEDIPDLSILDDYGLQDKFICLFGGNFGKPQAIEHIIDLAVSVKHISDIVFLMIGTGTEFNRIKSLVTDLNLDNVVIQNRIPREDFLKLVPLCNVGLVNLSEKFTIPNIPSRTLAYWNCALPVLACIDENTDMGEIIEKHNGGLFSIAGDLASYKKNLLYLFNNREEAIRMGVNGRIAIQEVYNSNIITTLFLNQLIEFNENN
ncbi:MAG: glycosyltransferase family 4 protein [Vallitalea sp.]|nr:glycosyltransferase family 4 protein [Vallitalea sp.]